MLSIIVYVAFYFCAVLFLFCCVQRPLFMAYNLSLNTEVISRHAVAAIYRHGIVTDRIAASYITAISLLTIILHTYLPMFCLQTVLTVENLLLAMVVSLITVSDTVLYKFWQYKLDSSVLIYLKHLDGAFASVSKAFVLLAMLSFALLTMLMFLPLQAVAWFATPKADITTMSTLGSWLSVPVFLAVIAVLFGLIRGFQRRPYNPSVAYHSKNFFYNHAAVNPMYNFIYSLSVKDDFKGQFHTMPDEECNRKFAPLFPTGGKPQTILLNTTRPNILLIVWESLCARYMETLGGKAEVLTNMDRLSREGVFFTHVDAGSFRTERGLVCLLSGYLAQPTTTVIRHTTKLPNLPALPKRLREVGYDTMALHGGNCLIMHKADYYYAVGHDTLLTIDDFPHTEQYGRGAWGIHDGYMFNWLFDNVQEKSRCNKPFFTTFQTLSSHEPFKVPYRELADDVENAFAYTDHCFGEFVDRLKKSPAWDNLLIIVTGDHGFNGGDNYPYDKYVHIPLLMLGGAVKAPIQIDKIVAQTDLPATLLGQMGMPHEEFIFSRDVLADTYTYPFAFHTFNNGFLFRDDTGFTHYDSVGQMAISSGDSRREETAKVILQKLYEDLANR